MHDGTLPPLSTTFFQSLQISLEKYCKYVFKCAVSCRHHFHRHLHGHHHHHLLVFVLCNNLILHAQNTEHSIPDFLQPQFALTHGGSLEQEHFISS